MLAFMRPTRPKTAAERKARVEQILQALDKRYPNVTCALDHASAWQLLVATILSAQCTDKRVNMVTPALFRRYPTVADLAHAHPAEVSDLIRTTGFFNNKTKSIIGAAKKLLAEFGGDAALWLNCCSAVRRAKRQRCWAAYGIAEGVVVDTHVQRMRSGSIHTRSTPGDRARPDEDAAAGKVGLVFAPDHPSRPPDVRARSPSAASAPDLWLCKDKVTG
jgi:endonuclease-3